MTLVYAASEFAIDELFTFGSIRLWKEIILPKLNFFEFASSRNLT